MKITVLEKEYNIPEEFINRFFINKKWKSLKSTNKDVVYTSICVLDANALFSLQRWLKTITWRINVQLDSLSDVKEYAKEATVQKRELTKELREMEKFLLDIHKLAGIKLTKLDNVSEMNLFIDADGKVVVFDDRHFFKHLKEVVE